jgi:IclR family transcriptional regulator, KDG regulon repressor
VDVPTRERRGQDFIPVKSAIRTLEVIDLLARNPQGASFVEIQRRTGWPRSSTYNLLRTMAETGHIAFDEDERTYRIGLRLWEAGQAFTRAHDLGRVSRPFLRRASAELNETVQLAVLDGLDNVYIAKEESDHHLKLVSEIGSRLPAYATGLGKVLLASLDPEELERRLDGVELQAFTRTTLTDKAALRVELESIRRNGYATDEGEYTAGVFCVAVPIRDAGGGTPAAMSASVPIVRLDEGLRPRRMDLRNLLGSD